MPLTYITTVDSYSAYFQDKKLRLRAGNSLAKVTCSNKWSWRLECKQLALLRTHVILLSLFAFL